MSFFFIGLFLVAFQVTCHGASERLFPVPPLPVDISQEETHVEKRALDEDACLQAHNYHRALHQNTSYLIWDATLAQDAQDWADRLAQRGLELAEGTGQGENLHWSWSTSAASCDLAVQSWYFEESRYDYNNPPQTLREFINGGYLHFTQMVWKGTTHVGVGLKTKVNSEGYTETFIVARYYPKGNIIGQFAENVKPLEY
ncbi:ectin-like isoform X2 [Oculina patagonica]